MNFDTDKLFYILDENKNPVPATAAEFDSFFPNCSLGRDKVNGCTVSTVFLGMDFNPIGGLPMLFETMIFTNRKGSYKRLHQKMARYCTYEEALFRHATIVRAVKHKNLTGLSRGLRQY